MGKKQKIRIDTSGSSDSFGNDAFQGLSSLGLPQGECIDPSNTDIGGNVEGNRKGRRLIRLDVKREKSGRAGKTVTTIRGIEVLPEKEKIHLLKQLKKQLATGGTLTADAIEIQGDFVERVLSALGEAGYRAVRAGG